MSNIRLKDHTWDTSCLFDISQNKSQDVINAELYGGISGLSWEEIVEAVRIGATIPNGTEFSVSNSFYGNVEFVTRRMNVDNVYDDMTQRTITIQTKYLIPLSAVNQSAAGHIFDRPEAFHEALETAIPAGTVCKFTTPAFRSWVAGTYNFTATQEIPVGSMLCVDGYADTTLDTQSVSVYASPKATTASATYAISSGDGGATYDFGTWGTDCNHPGRIAYGSNNFAQSNILQYLNGDSGANNMDSIWIPKSKYDMMDATYYNYAGWLGGFPSDFKAALKTCGVLNITNSTYEDSDSGYNLSSVYSVPCKVWLPSIKEIYGINIVSRAGLEKQLPYYYGLTNKDRVMYAPGDRAPSLYWMRTPFPTDPTFVYYCDGSLGGDYYGTAPASTFGIAPMAILA